VSGSGPGTGLGLGFELGFELVVEGIPLHERPRGLVHRWEQARKLLVLTPGVRGRGVGA
jgi:hypothetical protein